MSIFFKENLILVSIINDNYDYVFKGYLYKYFCSVMANLQWYFKKPLSDQ